MLTMPIWRNVHQPWPLALKSVRFKGAQAVTRLLLRLQRIDLRDPSTSDGHARSLRVRDRLRRAAALLWAGSDAKAERADAQHEQLRRQGRAGSKSCVIVREA